LRAVTSLAGVGDYRVFYTVEDGQLIVWVLAVGIRRDIYRQVP
jgi:mRNA interferase RelE/StbE